MQKASIRMNTVLGNKNYTITTEGYVPSYTFKGIECPVKVISTRRTMQDYPMPVRSLEGNRLIYALPGGLDITPKDVQAEIIPFPKNEFGGNYRRSLR